MKELAAENVVEIMENVREDIVDGVYTSGGCQINVKDGPEDDTVIPDSYDFTS